MKKKILFFYDVTIKGKKQKNSSIKTYFLTEFIEKEINILDGKPTYLHKNNCHKLGDLYYIDREEWRHITGYDLNMFTRNGKDYFNLSEIKNILQAKNTKSFRVSHTLARKIENNSLNDTYIEHKYPYIKNDDIDRFFTIVSDNTTEVRNIVEQKLNNLFVFEDEIFEYAGNIKYNVEFLSNKNSYNSYGCNNMFPNEIHNSFLILDDIPEKNEWNKFVEFSNWLDKNRNFILLDENKYEKFIKTKKYYDKIDISLVKDIVNHKYVYFEFFVKLMENKKNSVCSI